MKKSYLAAAAILGAAVFAGQAQAAKISLGDGKSFKMGFRAKVHAIYEGKRGGSDTKSDYYFTVPNARIYAKGSITKIFKWGFQGDFAGKINTSCADLDGTPGCPTGNPDHSHQVKFGVFKIVDAFVMLDFAKEVKLYAGAIKVPFELHSGIQSGWSYVMPTGPAYGLKGTGAGNPFTNPAAEKIPGSGSRSPQVGIWGKVADGLFKYYLYAVDGTERDSSTDVKTGYGVRVEFAPTMAGYKGHPGYVLKETYLGKQDTLVLGLSYFTQDYGSGAKSQKSFGVDLLWEQNFGMVTPNISIGYVNHKDVAGSSGADVQGILLQGQVLFNQNTILGKPAVGVRWAQSDPDVTGVKKAQVFGVVGQLYVKGVGNRIALSIDNIKDDNAVAPAKDSYTDITLAFWYNF
ncbi:MAG: hypothetical protein GXO18_03100 [Aquificae bacterium]|nr:hypothetical protein [Aquificota bacterium]